MDGVNGSCIQVARVPAASVETACWPSNMERAADGSNVLQIPIAYVESRYLMTMQLTA